MPRKAMSKKDERTRATSLESRTRDQLLNRARELGIPGRSSMRKAELISAIREQNR